MRVSQWLFDVPHPAAGSSWAADIVIVDPDAFRDAQLPVISPGFRFDACLEFKYLSDFWTLPGAARWGQPKKGIGVVSADAVKIGRYLSSGVCRTGYVVVFEEADSGFGEDFTVQAKAQTGSEVRFVRGWGDEVIGASQDVSPA